MRSAGYRLLDEYARDVAQRVVDGELDNDEAVRIIISEAVASGVVARQVVRHHGAAMQAHERDEFIGGATFLLVHYALPTRESPSPVDVRPFALEGSSVSGWASRTVGAMRSTRIEREIASRRDIRLIEDDEDIEQAPQPAVGADIPDEHEIREAARDRLRTGETVLLIHASVLHQLLDGPALRAWSLTAVERSALLCAIDEDPGLPLRALDASRPSEGAATDLVRCLWSSWDPCGVREVLARSSEDRDIAGLLTRASLALLPRPAAGRRDAEVSALRSRVRSGLRDIDPDLAGSLVESFLAARVALYADKDRRRRPLTCEEQVERASAASAFPSTLAVVASASGIGRDDLLSGLTGLLLDPVPVLDSRHFTPTTWRFA